MERLMVTAVEANRVIREREAAAYLGVSLPYLRKLRYAGTGPAHVRLGGRALGYRLGSLIDYLDAGTVDPSKAA